jgi:phospholipase C
MQPPLKPTIWNVLPTFSYFKQNPDELLTRVGQTSSIISDLGSGKLATVSWIMPNAKFPNIPSICGSNVSEHPPARPDCGMDYVATIVNAVMRSSYWLSTAIVITWDDWGGFYDDVPPPRVDKQGFGLREPTLVISPWGKAPLHRPLAIRIQFNVETS